MSNEERFQHFANLALNALAEASACRGRDRRSYMSIAMTYGEMAIHRPRSKSDAVMAATTMAANGNGAVDGAAHHHQQ
jgi:hypothetical protein